VGKYRESWGNTGKGGEIVEQGGETQQKKTLSRIK